MPNQLRIDPTRTTLLRRQFVADMTRRFKKLSRAIQTLIVDDDALGLGDPTPLLILQERQIWRFKTNAQKVAAYRKWLKQQVDAGILTPVGGISGKPWTAPYIESAYKKAVLRAYTDLRATELAAHPTLFEGGQAEFLRTAFSSPEATRKIELLYTRSFNELEGVTAAMDQQMSRILAEGLVQGRGARVIARNLRINVTKMTKTRANVIARTEIIRSHAEGQLDAYERLGVEELQIMAEWSTAGDERVCIECGELEGVVMTVKEARGLIPRHPNCRCTWIPASKARKEAGQLWGVDKDRAIEKSIQAEGPKKVKRTATEIRKRSVWAGKGLVKVKKIPKRVISKPKSVPKLKKDLVPLTKSEKFAIEDYTSDKFLGLNKKLRQGLSLEPADKTLLKKLSSGLEKLPSYEKDVFRKVSFNTESDLKKFLKAHRKNSIVKYKTPISSSTDNRRFLFSGKGDVNITIKKSISGKDISSFSKNPVEKEVLFDRNKSFKILSVKKNNLNAYELVLEEII